MHTCHHHRLPSAPTTTILPSTASLHSVLRQPPSFPITTTLHLNTEVAQPITPAFLSPSRHASHNVQGYYQLLAPRQTASLVLPTGLQSENDGPTGKNAYQSRTICALHRTGILFDSIIAHAQQARKIYIYGYSRRVRRWLHPSGHKI
jgi:hypothetical protein